MEDIGPATQLTAELEVKELRDGSAWHPTFIVHLEGQQHDMGIRLTPAARGGRLQAEMAVASSGRPPGIAELKGWTVDGNKRFTVRLDWSSGIALAVSIDATPVGKYKLDFAPSMLEITASSGELKGHSLVLGGSRQP